jgi:hypothetical protein
MSVFLDQALVATADSIDLLDAMSTVRLHCEAAYDVVNTRAQSSTGYDRTRKFWQGQRKSFAADLLTQMPAVVRRMSARRKQSSVNHPVFPWAFRPLNDKGSLRLDTAFEQAQGLLHVVDVVGSN